MYSALRATTAVAKCYFAVGFHEPITEFGGLGLNVRVRVTVGVSIIFSKLLGSNCSPNLNRHFALTLTLTINLP